MAKVEDPSKCFVPFVPIGLVSPQIQTGVPISAWVNSLTWQLNGQQAASENANSTMGFWFVPTKQDFGAEGYMLQLRHGIAQFTEWEDTKEKFLEQVTVAVQMSQETLDKLIVARAAVETAISDKALDVLILSRIAEGKIQLIKGNELELRNFFKHFDPWPSCFAAVTVPSN